MVVVGTSLCSKTGCPLGTVLVSDPGHPVYIHLAVYEPPVFKVRYPKFVIYTLQATLMVPCVVSRANFVHLPSGTFLNSLVRKAVRCSSVRRKVILNWSS